MILNRTAARLWGRAALFTPCLIVLVGGVPRPAGAQQPAAAVSIAPAVTGPLTTSERASRVAALRTALHNRLAKQRITAADPKAVLDVRDVSNGAFASLLVDEDANFAQESLRRVWAVQDNDEKSKTWGKLPWQINRNTVTDDNSIEFGTQAWGPLLIAYGDKLPPDFRAEMAGHVRAAFATLRRHEVKVGYTNIFLMKTTCLLLMGQAIGDEKAEAEGREMLKTWIDYTRQNGIREFGAPTYYSTSLNSLNIGYLYARDKDVKAQYKRGLDYFWADACAHYFAPRQSLAGPHSRDYDFLRGAGGFSLSLYAEGLRDQKITDIDLEKAHLVAGQSSPNGYHPGENLIRLARMENKEVRARWDTSDPNAFRETLITPDFAIGGTNGTYGPQDKMVSLEMNGPKEMPVISFSPQDTEGPYGKTQTLDKSGHSKPHHLPLKAATVQNNGAMLVLLCLDPQRVHREAEVWATSVLLPLRVDEIRAGRRSLTRQTDTTQEIRVRPGGVVGVRDGKTGVALRFLEVEKLGGDPSKGDDDAAPLVLAVDAEGLKNDACRLTATHWAGKTGTFGAASKAAQDEPVRVAVLVLTARCETDADFDALLRRAQTASSDRRLNKYDQKTTWDVSVKIGADTLAIDYDVNALAPTSRTVNGKPIDAPGLLSVNGVEVGLPLFSPPGKP